MIKSKRKYAAYDPETEVFIGFYKEGRKDLPDHIIEVDKKNFMEDKGQHTHINPEKGTFYTPEESEESKRLRDRKWCNNMLRKSERYMLVDHDSTPEEHEEMIAFRRALKNFPESGVKPTPPDFFTEEYF